MDEESAFGRDENDTDKVTKNEFRSLLYYATSQANFEQRNSFYEVAQ